MRPCVILWILQPRHVLWILHGFIYWALCMNGHLRSMRNRCFGYSHGAFLRPISSWLHGWLSWRLYLVLWSVWKFGLPNCIVMQQLRMMIGTPKLQSDVDVSLKTSYQIYKEFSFELVKQLHHVTKRSTSKFTQLLQMKRRFAPQDRVRINAIFMINHRVHPTKQQEYYNSTLLIQYPQALPWGDYHTIFLRNQNSIK